MNNNLPPKWFWVKLGDICEVVRGGSPRPMGNPKYFVGNIPFIKISDITKDDSKFVNDSVTKVNEEGVKKSRLLKKGSLILSNSGSVCIPKFLAVDACIHDGFVSFVNFFKETDLDFLYHFFNYIRPFIIQKHKQGITQVNLNTSIVSDFDIPLPPFLEQKKIGAKIEELFSELDNGIEQLVRAKQQLKIYRQAVLSWAFSGKLVGGVGSRRLTVGKKELMKAAEPGVKYNGLPKGWKWVKNKDLLKYVTSGSRGWKKYYSHNGARFIRTQDINKNRLNLENAAYVNLPERVEGKRSLVEEGDLLMTITGANVGKVAIVDFSVQEAYVSQSVALLKYYDKKMTKYLWYYFQAPDFGKTFIENLVYGMGRPVLSLENMREVDVLTCPHENQEVIISEIESHFSVADKLEQTIDEGLKKAETLRQSILKKAFEGRLV